MYSSIKQQLSDTLMRQRDGAPHNTDLGANSRVFNPPPAGILKVPTNSRSTFLKHSTMGLKTLPCSYLAGALPHSVSRNCVAC